MEGNTEMSGDTTTKFETFKQEWSERIEGLEGEELSPRECNNIKRQLHDEFLTVISIKPTANFTFNTEAQFKSLESDLETALNKAKSRYRKNKKRWYEFLPEKLVVQIHNLVGINS